MPDDAAAPLHVPEAAAEPRLHPALAAALVALAAGAVLVLEILGVRLLAPYVGLTLETTTSIIGCVLAGIAVGAAVGGLVADRVPPRALIASLFAGGGLLALATVPLVRALGPGARGGGDDAAFAMTLVALLPAAAVLSAITPAVIRLQLRDLGASGRVVGGVSAWATGGALLGTFGTGFVLVPLLPVSTAVVLVGGALVLVGLALGTRTRRAAALTALSALGLGALPLLAGSPCQVETEYHCASVRIDPQRASGRTLVLDDLRHSYVDLADPTRLQFAYVRWLADAIDSTSEGPLDAVFVGGGGFTLPRWLLATRPGSRARVLEVDAELVALGRERLGLRTGSALQVTTGDARMTLARLPAASADAVVGDAFGGRAVPWHLATTEWLEEVRRVLRPGGLYAINVIDLPPLALLRAEARTLLARFADVRLVRAPAGGNFVLLARDRPLPPAAGSTARRARTLPRSAVASFARGAQVLRDDDAPADQLLTTP